MTWAELVELASRFGPVVERTSRYADKPALFLDRREIAHCDGTDVDLRLTKRVLRERGLPAARDWLTLPLSEVTEELVRDTVLQN